MGSILSIRTTKEGKMIFEVIMDYNEALGLQGHTKKIHMFSEHVSMLPSGVSLRGRQESTKYLLIPKELRKDLKFNARVSCQKIETDTKVIFIYMADKL